MKRASNRKSHRSPTAPAASGRLRRQACRSILAGSIAALAATALTLGAASKARAATATWTPTGAGTYAWNLNSSPPWDTALFPNGFGDMANLNIDILGNQTVNLGQTITLGVLSLGDSSGQSSFTIAPAGGSLIFDNGGATGINKMGDASDVISAGMAVAAGNTMTVEVEAGILTLAGALSGDGGLSRSGNGTLVLRGTSNYTGETRLMGGMTLMAPTADSGAVLGNSSAVNNTVVQSGATLAYAPDNNGSSGITSPAELITISGNGFRNNGALRGFMGANGSNASGVVTMDGAARIQNDLAGTLTLTAPFEVSNTLTAGGAGFVSVSGLTSGSADINHYGLSGFRLTGVGATQTYSGTISSSLGEIRADTGSATLANTPYNAVAGLRLKNSWLRLVFGSAAGAPTGNDTANSKFSTTAPISLSSSQIFIENSAFSSTSSNFFNYNVVQGLGTVTMDGGHNRIGFRSAGSGTITLTLADVQRVGTSTTLELFVENLSGTALGAGAKHRILNSAIVADVPFVGGWAYTFTGATNVGGEFVKYDFTGGNGYTALTGSPTAITGAAATDDVRPTATQTGFGAATINSLNIAGAVTIGSATDSLDITSGGLLSSNGANTVAAGTITSSSGTLFDIATASHNISSDITGAIDLVKVGTGTTSYLTANSYTGTTFINEGQFRGVIGSKAVALGSGNLTFGGSPNSQATYENDGDFTRALGTGVGEVQLLGGGGTGGGSVGFSAFGAPIDINFGGAGATVTWGSATFNPGIFTLNGGNATHVATLVNNLDLGGEQRYIRLDGNASGGNRAVIGLIAGDITNGSIVKRGGGQLIFTSPKSYEGGTLINEGELWLTGAGTAGANVTGNDIQVYQGGLLYLEAPSNVGSRQLVILQNGDVNTPAALNLGKGYGTGSDIVFNSFAVGGGTLTPGGNNFFIANNQSGQARRVAVTIGNNSDFQADIPGLIRAVAPNVEAWFGADNSGSVFTGTTLSPSGGTVSAYRLGGNSNNSGVLTIAKANVLTDTLLGAPTPLIVGAPDQNARTYTQGTIYIPEAQSFSGQVTVGSGGILKVGKNGSLGTGTADILLRGGEIRFDVAGGNFGGSVGTQYAARNLSILGGTSTIRTTTPAGGGFNTVQLGDLTFDANRALQVFTIGTNFTDLAVNDITFANSANTIDLTVGVDNSFQSGAGILTVNGVIGDQVTGLQTLRKNNGGVLILNNNNTYDGGTIITQGRLVLSNTGAAGVAGTTISLTTNSDRRSDVEFRINGAGPLDFDYGIATSGGNDNSTRVITVGASGPGSEDQLVRISSLTIGHGGAYTVGGASSSALYFDGANGYRLEVTGTTTLNRDINLRVRGAVVTLSGQVVGVAANDLEKNEQGTLILSGNNTYLGTTTVSNGYLILGHDKALGLAASDVVFRNNVFSQILAAGTRTIDRNFINTATGSIQTLGGLDAGAKLFTGNVNLSTRGMSLTAIAGGDVTFGGVISGAFGLQKEGNGTVILNPLTGTGNTYTGITTVAQGILIGQAQAASGSPFGTGGMTILDAEVRLRGRATATTTTSTAGALTVAGGARVGVEDTSAGAFSTTLNFGSLVRSGAAGTVTFVPVTGALGTTEKFTFTSALPNANGIVGPWAVHTTSGTNNAANFITGGATSVSSYVYGGATGSIDTAAGSTQVFDASGVGGTLTGNRAVFALRTDTNIDLGGFRLGVGDSATPANGGGIILNNGADIVGIAGSRINIENTALSIYVDDAAVSSLNVPIRNFRNNATNTLSTVFTKFGAGTLEIGAVQEFQGNIELNRGTLSFGAANVLPFFSNLNGTSGSVIIMSPGTTVDLNGFDQEFGNLSAVNPSNSFQFSAGTLILGGNTLTVGREDSSQTFNGQILGGAGSRLVKAGAGTLTLDNINGNKPNTLDTLEITRGAVSAWVNDNSWATPTTTTSAIPSTTTILLRGGQFTALAIGDSTSNQQRINIGNNVIHQGADSVFATNRATGSGSNKLMTFNDLTLDVQRFLVTGGNNFIPRFDGTTTLTNHARVQTDISLVLAGTITDGGKGFTLNKIGGSDLEIGGDNAATWSGGTVITGGTLIFGTRGLDDIRTPGITLVNLATANAGTGDIIVNQGSAIRITSPANIMAGQEVRVYGSERGSTTRVDLLTDALLTDYGLRSLTDGSIALGMSEGLWTTPINLGKLGSGQWGISALSNTFYTATTLGASIDNRYIFTGTSAGTLTITNSDVLTGTASVELGKSSVFSGGAPAGSGANIRFYGDQSYTGNTTIYRQADATGIGAFLELTGDSNSPVFDVYGRLTLRGAGRLTNDAGVQVNTLNLRPGGDLRLDYNMDVNDSFVTSRLNESNLGTSATENKLGDTTPLLLDAAGLNLISSSSRVNQETVGAITIRGGAGITLERSNAGQIVLNTPSITRVGQATLGVRVSTTAELGSINIQSEKLVLTGAAPAQTNGIVAPWMVNLSGRNFLSYDNDLGFTNAPFATNAGVGGNAFFANTDGTTVAQYLAANSSPSGNNTLTGTKDVYALRIDEFSGTVDNTFDGGQINIWSGGLILGNDDSNRVNFNTTAVYFGDGTTPVEGIVYGGHSSPNSRFGGVVTANNLTFDGPGGFQLTNTANAITGTIQMNGGRLYLDGAGTQGTATEIILSSDYANNFNGNQMADLRLRHDSTTTTFTGLTITVAQNVPYALIQAERYAGTSTSAAVQFQNLNILGTDGPAGTLLRLYNSNSNTNVLGTTTIGGTSAVGMNVNANTWDLQGAITGAAPIVKTGGGVLRWDGDNSGFTGGFTLNAGEWRLTTDAAADYDVAGTGDLELNFGVVRLANAVSSSVFTAPGQDISVNGQITFIVDRNGGSAGVARTIGANNDGTIFSTTNSPYIIFQAAFFGDDIIMEKQVVINGSPTFRVDNADLFLRDVVSGQGAFNKTGIYNLHFDNNEANTWTGGFNNYLGITVLRQANATLGTGPVQVFAGSGISISSVAQLGTTGLTKVLTSGTALPVIGTRLFTATNNASFDSVTAAVAAVISGTGNGVLAIDAGQTMRFDPMMATRDGGVFAHWQLGSQEGGGAINANSITPWGDGTQFLLGGGSSTLTLNPVTAGADQLAGVGNRVILGVSDTVMGYGAVAFGSNANNSYGAGTIVNRTRNVDGGYRGFILSLQGGAVGTGTTFRTPLGAGRVDVYGEIRVEGNSGTAVGGLLSGSAFNSNLWVLHGGSRLRFDNGSPFTGSGTTGTLETGILGGEGRWADSAAITLNSSVLEVVGDNTNHVANREVVGDLSVGGGSELVARHVDNNARFAAELQVANLLRVGSGTLMLRHDIGELGINASGGSGGTGGGVERFTVLSGAGTGVGQVPVHNNMVDPWIFSKTENQFLKYDATLGFQILTQGGAPSNYISTSASTLNNAIFTGGNLNDGNVILDVTANPATLGANLDLYALRVSRDINQSTDGSFDKIIIRSGGLLLAANNSPTINADLYFGASGLGDGEALINVNAGSLQINGRIYASEVTKSGSYTNPPNASSFLNIRTDQPQFAGNWNINGGVIQFLTPNAQGSGAIFINGAHIRDNDNVLNFDGDVNELRYNFNSGTPDLFTWAGGKITVNDIGAIRSVATSDRLDQIADIDLKTTGGGGEGIIFFRSDASRHTIRTGTVTLYDNYLISVDASSFGPGSTSGVQLGAGNGTGGLNNQGLYDVRLSGDGILSLGDNSLSFTGGHTFSVGDGTVRVLSNGAFGDASNSANLRSTGVLEIAVSNFQPLATLVQEVGSIERWAVDDARGTGNYTLGDGVHLQVFTDISGTRTIDLAGGSIMGYLPLDFDEVAVIQTIHQGVTINLTADSALGQVYPAGTSNGANHIFYDMGKLNTTTNLDPSNVGLRGSYLVIDGNITGNFGLTKLGQDVIKLAGSNSFGDLSIEGGIIQIGRTNALAATTVVKTRGEGTSGILDLNGYDQKIAGLEGPGGSVNNSAFDRNTLIVADGADHTYGGSIGGSVNLTKQGVGVQHLAADNNYGGVTAVEEGELHVALGGVLSRTEAVNVDVSGTLRVDGVIHNGAAVSVDGLLNGTGTVGAIAVNAGGTVNPGNTVGILNAGSFSMLNTTSTLSIEINKPLAGLPNNGVTHDTLNIAAAGALVGNVGLAGDLQLTITSGVGIQENDLFFIILNDGIDGVNGSFATVNGGAFDPNIFSVGGQMFTLSYSADSGTNSFTGGNDVALLAVVPEPNSLAMLAGSLGMALGLQRFRRRAI